MGKGGIDTWVCGQLREMLATHPYDSPEKVDGQLPEPVLVSDLLEDVWRAASREQLAELLLSALSGETPVRKTRGLLSRSHIVCDLGELVKAVGLDIIAFYAIKDTQLVAEDARRRTYYESGGRSS